LVELFYRESANDSPQLLGQATTDADGRAQVVVAIAHARAAAGEFAVRARRGASVRSWRLKGLPQRTQWDLLIPAHGRKKKPPIPAAQPELAVAANEPKRPTVVENSIGMRLASIPQGEFLMGSPEEEDGRDDDEVQRRVLISRPFSMSVHEVTQAQYERVMGTNPSYFSPTGKGARTVAELDASRLPVDWVSWQEATEFCRRLSLLPAEQQAGRSYRLPTEAEWEYACRAGTTTPFHFGSQLNGHQANCDGEQPYGTKEAGPCLFRPSTVGSYPANAFGLHDMHGNVCEWCMDLYDRGGAPPAASHSDSPSSTIDRVYRGGHWSESGGNCRSANRYPAVHGERAACLGFRVVAVPQPSKEDGVDVYAWRTMPRDERWLQTRGASVESEQAVADGLEWLARHQSPAGVWCDECLAVIGTNPHARCQRGGACSGAGAAGNVDMALTGLAVLAFQAGGHYHFNGNRYSANVERGLQWIMDHQRSQDGALFGLGFDVDHRRSNGVHMYFMYEHGIATFALAEACALARASNRPPDPAHLRAATAAIRFIERTQHDDGGWRYKLAKSEPSDTSVAGWQVLALKTAIQAGIDVDPHCLARLRAFFKSCEMGRDGRTAYKVPKNLKTEATTGIGMMVHEFLLHDPHSRLVRDAAPYLAKHATRHWGRAQPEQLLNTPKGTDYYQWYNCTMAMSQVGGEAWNEWNAAIRDLVTGLQVRGGGCEHGSWSPHVDVHCTRGGRVCTTALAVLSLEAYYRYGVPVEQAKQ
jgi:formylglycine-generating enzyme required for sulfatase activity